ncbi:serine/threonine protein kinase psk1 [Linnemannia exigua]|uniref:Serine/threonine protein kinase psk1 n=1 Tax=Linnemannia exigua TaxID=604196 RepID=A0AAD4DIQ2_9FUNG|nr:serine/threonine protein kinase psk1 [Linnemannia exigua]
MDLFSFDHDDHPNLRERTFSVDSTQGAEHQQDVLAQLQQQQQQNGATAASSPFSGFYQTNGSSSNKHLPAFFHQVDRDQSATPETTFRKCQDNQANNIPALALTRDAAPSASTNSSDSESEKPHDVEYEVKIDQDFDAHAPQNTDSRGQSPRMGQPASDPNGTTKGAISAQYGKVYLVRHIATNALYAMKVLKKASIIVHAKDTECTMSERKILEAIRHPFIVKLHYAFQTDHRLYLILEYASGGELFTHLASERMFSEENTAFYAAQLVLALEHLHSLGIIYRDLKPENIMLNAHGDIVLTDFGLSKVPLEHSDGRTGTVCGTIEYMAPEVISERVQYDRTVDFWSLGIVIHDMLTGSPPFIANNRKKTMDAIMNKKLNLPYYLSSDAKDLLGKLLKRTPSARLGFGPKGIENIKSHRFFRKINWKLLTLRELEPPITPFLSDPESVENFNAEFTTQPVQESPIFTHGSVHINGRGLHPGDGTDSGTATPGSGYHTPARYLASANGGSASVVGIAAAMNGLDLGKDDDHHPAGIPMAKTRSNSPDHHHFQDFSYVATSHLPSLGYLDDHGEH